MRKNLPTNNVKEINHVEAGKRIRAMRLKANKSLRWLANEMDLSAPFISDLELGRRNWTEDKFHEAVNILSEITN